MKPTRIAVLGFSVLAATLLIAASAYASLATITGLSTGSTTASSTVLSWTATPEPSALGYKIFQNGSQIATVTPTSTVSINIINLLPNTNYVLGVQTYNLSENSALATTSVTTLADSQAPSVPVITSATPVSTSQINLVWSAATDNVAVTGYKVYRDDGQVATTSGLSLADSGLATSTTYKYNVSAYDASGNVSATSSSISATTLATSTPDTTAPTQPTNLSASAVSSSQINLNWTASTDSIGVIGYNIYRNGEYINNTAGISFNNTDLLASTTYSYYVVAYDAALNHSASSSIASATTLAAGSPTTTASIKVFGNGSNGRLINLRSNAKIKVIVYGGSSFNVKDIVKSSVTFAGAPAVNNWRVWYNRDRYIDRIFEFRARDMQDLAGVSTTTATTVVVHFRATTTKGQVIDLTTSVRVNDLKGWKKDHEREHDQQRLKDEQKNKQEHEREEAKKKHDVETQKQLLKQKINLINQQINVIKKETKNTINNLKQGIKEIKNSSKNNKAGKNGNKKDD